MIVKNNECRTNTPTIIDLPVLATLVIFSSRISTTPAVLRGAPNIAEAIRRATVPSILFSPPLISILSTIATPVLVV